MGVGSIRCHVIDVDDLAVAEAFWSEVTGLPVIGSNVNGRFSYLGQLRPWKHEVILQSVTGRKGEAPNRSHVDIGVADVDAAIRQIEAIGGRVKKAPSLYPGRGRSGKVPTIDWAVMQDPFGNEFCLVSAWPREKSRRCSTPPRRPQTAPTRLAPRRRADRVWKVATRPLED